MVRRFLFKHQDNPGRLSIMLLVLALALGTGEVWATGTDIAAGGYKYFRNYSKKDYDHHPQNLRGVAAKQPGCVLITPDISRFI